MSGRRVGHKRSDRRWEDENGAWASKLEARVFDGLRRLTAGALRRCDARDSFDYTTGVRSGICMGCGGRAVFQQRSYTPDFYLPLESRDGQDRGRYFEVKGYFPGPKRALLRAFLETGPSIDLRLILEHDGRATSRLTTLEYVHKFLKIPVHIWDGVVPADWLTG